MVEGLLAEYYSAGNKLKVLDLPFNVGEDKAVAEWSKDATKLISELSGFRHVVVFVTMHSVPDNGDLWLGNNRSNKPCTALVDNMSANLFYHFILIFTVSLAVAKCYFATIWANSSRLNAVYAGIQSCCKPSAVFYCTEARPGQVRLILLLYCKCH
jgi:hypothetical protein